MANSVLRGACLKEADMRGAQLDAAVLTGADLRKANLRGAGFRGALLEEADLPAQPINLGADERVKRPPNACDCAGAHPLRPAASDLICL
jgi:uncharacterized protein YjbI with pentapeptide repeats